MDELIASSAVPRPRLTARRFFADLVDEVFSLDRGLPWTFAMMFRDPRAVVRGYVDGDDARATRPLRYFLVVAIGVTLLGQLLDPTPRKTAGEVVAAIERDLAAQRQAEGPPLRSASHRAGYALGARMTIWSRYYTDRILLALMPFLAAGLFIAFARQRFNFAEHWVVAMYAVAQLYLVGGIAARMSARLDPVAMAAVVAGVAALYLWICASVYDGRAVSKLARALAALLLAAFLLALAAVVYALIVIEFRIV
ncbi:MAG TPA: DUF3667 domain-containing protein [Xanthomonadales bacterium]|nr:DUF3667 domain-containing protein [Xanthomonadales bacterium]